MFGQWRPGAECSASGVGHATRYVGWAAGLPRTLECRVSLRAWCLVLIHVQCPGGWVAVCGSCRCVVLFAACVVLLACVGGLTFLACACAFDGYLLQILLVSTSQVLRLFVTHYQNVECM